MNQHQQYVRIVPEAETAVLFIHGIIGTPDHFRNFIPLVPSDWSVYNLLLDGHGKEVADFARTSMKKWKKQVSDVLHTLKQNHKKIIIVAHSMGTLFAFDSAIKNPETICHLFLLASPLSIHPKPSLGAISIKVLFEKVDPEKPWETGAQRSYGIHPDKRLWKYLTWIPRFLELFQEIGRVRKIIPQLKTPCTVFQSKNDELVSVSSLKILEKDPARTVYLLPDSGHYHLAPSDEEFVLSEFQKLCQPTT